MILYVKLFGFIFVSFITLFSFFMSTVEQGRKLTIYLLMYTMYLNIIKKKGGLDMKKHIIYVVNSLIFVLCFLFILSSFFKIISHTCIEAYLSDSNNLVIVWIVGIAVAVIFTHPLYQEILAWRLPLKEWLQFHHLKQ